MDVTRAFCGTRIKSRLHGVIIFPLAFALWWQSKRRIWILAILAVFILSIYFSQSRNGILGLSVSIAVFFAVRYRIRWILSVSITSHIVRLCSCINPTRTFKDAVHRFVVKKENIRIEDVSITEVGRNRLMVWEPIMEKIREHPWQGSGFATGGTMHEKKHLMAHNSYLQVIQETGFIGLALILPLLAALLYVLFKISILHAPLPDRAIWAGIAATVAGGLANATFESWLLSLGNPGTLPFWLCAFLILSLIQKKQKKQKQVAYA